MKTYLSELRDSWPAWLGVSVGILMTNFCLSLSLLFSLSAQWSGLQGANLSAFLLIGLGNFLACAFVGASIISAATGLVVDARRGAIARFLLAGATPKQVRASLLTQLAAVTLVCSVVSNVGALIALQPALDYYSADRAADDLALQPAASYSPLGIVVASALCVAVALIGGYRQATRASDIPPVEALRQSQSARRLAMTGWRWAGVVALVLSLGICVAAMPTNGRMGGKEAVSNVFIAGMGVLILACGLVALLAPVVIGPLTRLWTAVVPSRFLLWSVARSLVITRADRLARSVVPVALAIGLTFGAISVGQTMVAVVWATYGETLNHTGVETFLISFALPLVVAVSGAVGVLVMTARQRDAELALGGVVGMTPAQRTALPVLEGLVITGTAVILALAMSATVVGFLAWGMSFTNVTFAFFTTPATFLVPTLLAALVVVASTLLPTLRAARLPEPKVIARLVAE